MSAPAYRLGIELGSTRITALALDAHHRMCAERHIDRPVADYRSALSALGQLIEAVETDIGERVRDVGLGIPGTLDPTTGRIRGAYTAWLNNTRLPADLSAAADRDISVFNQADCLAVSESFDGAGQGSSNMFAVVLDAGIDGGMMINGALINGRNGQAGAWGHNHLPWPTSAEIRQPPRCWCGRDGCIEAWLSGPGMSSDHHRRGGHQLTAQDIVARAETGERLAGATLRDWLARWARALASVINVIDPDVIVCGGALSDIRWLYSEVPKIWTRHTLADDISTRLLPATHGRSSIARGAAHRAAMQRLD